MGGIRSLAAARPVGTALRLFWADGVYFSPRLDHDKQCVLVTVAANTKGHKDIVGLVDGDRKSAQSWRELLLDLKRRGLEIGPELAVGDGALGFWKALREVYGEAPEQRCWVHKTINVLNQMPKSLQARAKGHLQDIWMAETKATRRPRTGYRMQLRLLRREDDGAAAATEPMCRSVTSWCVRRLRYRSPEVTAKNRPCPDGALQKKAMDPTYFGQFRFLNGLCNAEVKILSAWRVRNRAV